jgi:hypothetical protein
MFLGIDLGTQSLKATIISQNLKVLHEFNVNFEQEIKNERVQHGVNVNGNEVTTPPTCFHFFQLNFHYSVDRSIRFTFPKNEK